jgi:hypothetical protein
MPVVNRKIFPIEEADCNSFMATWRAAPRHDDPTFTVVEEAYNISMW